MKYMLFLCSLLGYRSSQAQHPELKTDTTIEMPKLDFDADSNLSITASATSSRHDFDFFVGKWTMYHRRLNKRLQNCHDWTEFQSTDEASTILTGIGNIDRYKTTEMPGMVGANFEGFTLRLFNPKTRLWSLYWVANNIGVLDPPQVGCFENNIGHFFAKDTYHGIPVIVVFRWDVRNKNRPIWSQAFSTDNGKTWEWNWYNVSVRM